MVHIASPSNEKVPVAQSLQSLGELAPVSPLYLPALQLKQVSSVIDPISSLYFPRLHSIHKLLEFAPQIEFHLPGSHS